MPFVQETLYVKFLGTCIFISNMAAQHQFTWSQCLNLFHVLEQNRILQLQPNEKKVRKNVIKQHTKNEKRNIFERPLTDWKSEAILDMEHARFIIIVIMIMIITIIKHLFKFPLFLFLCFSADCGSASVLYTYIFSFKIDCKLLSNSLFQWQLVGVKMYDMAYIETTMHQNLTDSLRIKAFLTWL